MENMTLVWFFGSVSQARVKRYIREYQPLGALLDVAGAHYGRS